MSDSHDGVADVQALIAQLPRDPAESAGVTGSLRRLCGSAARSLPASATGISVMTEDGLRGLIVASDPAAELIEELQITLGEGPCMDAFASRRPVLEPDVEVGGMSRWPGYAAAIHAQGVRAVFAFPLQVGSVRLGALDVYREQPGALSSRAIAQASAYAVVATMSLLQDQEDQEAHKDRQDQGWNSSPELLDATVGYALYQAQGMVMVQLGVSLGEAMARLRAHAYAEDRRLSDVAKDVVARRLRLDSDRS